MNNEDYQKVINLHKSGHSIANISEMVLLHEKTVEEIILKLREELKELKSTPKEEVEEV